MHIAYPSIVLSWFSVVMSDPANDWESIYLDVPGISKEDAGARALKSLARTPRKHWEIDMVLDSTSERPVKCEQRGCSSPAIYGTEYGFACTGCMHRIADSTGT